MLILLQAPLPPLRKTVDLDGQLLQVGREGLQLLVDVVPPFRLHPGRSPRFADDQPSRDAEQEPLGDEIGAVLDGPYFGLCRSEAADQVGPVSAARWSHALGLGQRADVFGGLAEDVCPELDLGAIHLLSQCDAEFAKPLVSGQIINGMVLFYL